MRSIYNNAHASQATNPASRRNLTTLSASLEVALIHFGCAALWRKPWYTLDLMLAELSVDIALRAYNAILKLINIEFPSRAGSPSEVKLANG